jgi:uncharacterized damage-inducible protein DinB
MLEAVRAVYGYNRWATERVLDAAACLTPEQWLTPGNAGRGSIRDTLVHIVSAQRFWLAWWDGSLRPEEARRLRLKPDDYPDVAAIRAMWEKVERATQDFLERLSEVQLVREYTNVQPDGRIFCLPLWQMMLHVANHGTQHRSEVAAMLTGFGHSPGDLDALVYFRPYGDSSPSP